MVVVTGICSAGLLPLQLPRLQRVGGTLGELVLGGWVCMQMLGAVMKIEVGAIRDRVRKIE